MCELTPDNIEYDNEVMDLTSSTFGTYSRFRSGMQTKQEPVNTSFFCMTQCSLHIYRLFNSLVVWCWLRVREVSGSIPSQGPRHTKDVVKNGTNSAIV